MSKYNERDTLLGMRFVTDLQVVGIGDGPGLAAPVRLRVTGPNGFHVATSLGKLQGLLRDGVLVEAGAGVSPRAADGGNVASLLRKAASLIDEARGQLDQTKTVCPHCQHGAFNNFPQAKAADRLTQMMERLFTLSRDLREGTDTDDDEMQQEARTR